MVRRTLASPAMERNPSSCRVQVSKIKIRVNMCMTEDAHLGLDRIQIRPSVHSAAACASAQGATRLAEPESHVFSSLTPLALTLVRRRFERYLGRARSWAAVVAIDCKTLGSQGSGFPGKPTRLPCNTNTDVPALAQDAVSEG